MLGKIIDSYELVEELGQGGMGIVFKAIDTSLDRLVALKVMHPALIHDERFLARFRSEAKALGRLRHPHIVDVYAFRHEKENLFIVMEYIAGGTLSDLIRNRRAIPWKMVVPIIQQTLSAVEYAHQKKVIHRDIKPSNILLTTDGVAKVTDFGLAKIQDIQAATMALTRTGFTGGTLFYMSPEQVEGLPNVDLRGDIYSLGMTYYEMLAGQSPFKDLSSEFAILKAINTHDFPSLDEVTTNVPPPLVEIIMKAVEREPKDRYQSAQAMQNTLQAWLDGANLYVPTSILRSPADPPPEPQKRQRNVHGFLKAVKALLASTRKKGASGADAKREPFPATLRALDDDRSSAPPATPDVPKKTVADDHNHTALSKLESIDQPGDSEPFPGTLTASVALLAPKDRISASPASTSSDDGTPAPTEARPSRKRTIIGTLAAILLITLAYILTRPSTDRLWGSGGSRIAEPTALLSIQTAPEGVHVYIDQRRAGITPLASYEIKAGGLSVHLKKEGFMPLDTPITVHGGETATLRVRLLPLLKEAETPEEDASGEDIVAVVPGAPGPDAQQGDQEPETTPEKPTLEDSPKAAQPIDPRGAVAPANDTMSDRRATTPLSAKTGTIKIIVRPFGDIFINDQRHATQTSRPFEAERVAGIYRIRAEHPNFGRWEKTARVQANKTQSVIFNFNQSFQVSITSQPTNAEIVINGEPRHRYTPGKISLPPGLHTITVRKDGYTLVGQPRTITLEMDRNEPLRFTLREEQ